MARGVTVSGIMKRLFLSIGLGLACMSPLAAQTPEPSEPIPDILIPDGNNERPDCEEGFEVILIPEDNGEPIYKCQPIEDIFPGIDLEGDEDVAANSDTLPALSNKPDYSRLTPEAERAARLEALFERLSTIDDPETGNLVAEEIWAIWLDSGSPSVNLLLKRGTAAQKKGDEDLARLMFEKVKELEPDYAEGWSRSGRLAFNERDFGKALVDITQALIYEPRHFYALWTLGNIFEQLGRMDEAFEAYSEAHKLYPALQAVEDQMNKLRKDVEGDVL